MAGDRHTRVDLQEAVKEDNSALVRTILEDGTVNINELDDSCKGTVLHYAVKAGRTDIVRLLTMVKGLDVNIQDTDGRTALHYAADEGRTDIVQALLEVEGLDVNIQDEWGGTALHRAAAIGRTDIVQVLLEVEGLDVNIQDRDGGTALHCAAIEGRTDIVQALLEVEGLDVNIQDEWGGTALHRAAARGRTDIVQVLLEVKGMDVNIQDKEGCTALHIAASRGHTDIVQALLEVEGLDVNIQDRDGGTALHCAAIEGRTDIVQALLEVEGLDVNIQDKEGGTALYCAAARGRTDTVQVLLQVEEVDVNIQDKYGCTALHDAAIEGHTATVLVLLEVEGLDVNIQDKEGCTALHYAAIEGYEEIVKLLITYPSTDLKEVQKCADNPLSSFIFLKGNLYKTIVELFVKQSEVSKKTALIKLFYIILQTKAKCDEAKETVLERLFKDDTDKSLLERFYQKISSIVDCEKRDDDSTDLQLIAEKIKKYQKEEFPPETSGCGCPSKKTGKEDGHDQSDSIFHTCSSRTYPYLSVVFSIFGIFFYTSDLFTDFTVGIEDITSFSARLGIFEICIVVFTLAHENINSAVGLYSTEEELLKMRVGKTKIYFEDWVSSSDLNFHPWLPIRVFYQVLWPFKIRTSKDGKWMTIKALRGLTFNLLSLVCLRPVVDRLNVLLHTPTGLRASIRQHAEQNSLKQYYLILEQIPGLLIQFYVFQIIFNDIGDKVMVECRDTFNYNNKLNNSEDNLFCSTLIRPSTSGSISTSTVVLCGVLFRVYSMSIPFFNIPSGILSLEGSFSKLDPTTPKMTKSTGYLAHAAYIMMVPARLFMFAGLMHAATDQAHVTIYIICRTVVDLVVVALRGYANRNIPIEQGVLKKLWSLWRRALFSLRDIFVISLRSQDAYLGSPFEVSYDSLRDWRHICIRAIPYFIEGLIGAVLIEQYYPCGKNSDQFRYLGWICLVLLVFSLTLMTILTDLFNPRLRNTHRRNFLAKSVKIFSAGFALSMIYSCVFLVTKPRNQYEILTLFVVLEVYQFFFGMVISFINLFGDAEKSVSPVRTDS